MKQIWITKAGDPEVLQVKEAENPVPAPGEYVIEVKASGVNFADVLARMGMYPDAPKIPCVVGYEVSGTIKQAGPEATGFKVGDRVFALTRFGGYATEVAVPSLHIFPMPKKMSFAEAATLPVQYFTAALALTRFGNVQRGERVLVHNAGGGVGIAAIQIAKHAGAHVIGTASSWKHDTLRELGADKLIDYRKTDWPAELKKLTNGGGAHVIIDPIGGKNLSYDLESLAPLGRLVAFGISESVTGGGRSFFGLLKSVLRMPRPSFLKLLSNNWSIAGLNLGHLWGELERLRDVGDEILQGWNEGYLKPVIAAEVPFDRPAEAHRLLQERKNVGKVVLTT